MKIGDNEMAILKDVLKNEHGDDITVYIEVDDEKIAAPTRGANPSHSARTILPSLVQDAFTQAMDLIKTCSTQVSSTVQAIPVDVRPKQFEVQFAVKIDAEFGAILTKASGEAQLQVTLIWGTLGNQ
jgi:hypothetical protein